MKTMINTIQKPSLQNQNLYSNKKRNTVKNSNLSTFSNLHFNKNFSIKQNITKQKNLKELFLSFIQPFSEELFIKG